MPEETPAVLLDIIKRKEKEVADLKKEKGLNSLRASAESYSRYNPPRDFYEAITKDSGYQLFNLIAEIKRRSPTAGEIRPNADVEEIARIYENSGASAISVLTDSDFGGEIGLIRKVKGVTLLPIFRKDFIIDEVQMYQSVTYGADSFLLIAGLLGEDKLKDYVKIARSLKIEPLVECHTKEDVWKAKAANTLIYGINNRDLHTMKINLETTARLTPLIPKEMPIVVESGIRSWDDVRTLHSHVENYGGKPAGMLVGEALMHSEDIGAKISELLGKNA